MRRHLEVEEQMTQEMAGIDISCIRWLVVGDHLFDLSAMLILIGPVVEDNDFIDTEDGQGTC